MEPGRCDPFELAKALDHPLLGLRHHQDDRVEVALVATDHDGAPAKRRSQHAATVRGEGGGSGAVADAGALAKRGEHG